MPIDDTTSQQWEKRLQSILRYAKIIKERATNSSVIRAATIKAAIEQLSEFGDDLFYFFYYGLQENKGYRFKKHPDIVIDTVLWKILDQISNDLTVLQNAFEQRIAVGFNQDLSIANTLEAADIHSWLVRQMLKKYLDEDTTVLTYLNRFPKVRVMPYAPVALIGIPATSINHPFVNQAEDPFLVIPHEFAHHVYWYGRLPTDSSETFATRPLIHGHIQTYLEQNYHDHPWVHNWVEEIFADAISCSILKAVGVESLQKMLLSLRNREFYVDNQAHPVPVLRPYIAMETLHIIDPAMDITDLETFWVNKLHSRGILPKTKEEARSSAITVAGQTTTIQALLTLLHPLLSEVVSLLVHIEHEVVASDSVSVEDLDKTWRNWPKSAIELAKQLNLIALETFQDEWKEGLEQVLEVGTPLPYNLVIDDTVTLLDFGGWTDEGPGPPNFG